MQKKFFRANNQIQAAKLRVIGVDGKQFGVLARGEALKLAQDEDLDLVEIAPGANPPVAKIVDLKRFLFAQEIKERKAKKSREVETKEIRVGPFISDHDLQTRINQAKKFLEQGDNFKLTVHFTLRHIRHPEFGEKVATKVKEALGDFARVEREPKWEGRRFTIIFARAKYAKS